MSATMSGMGHGLPAKKTTPHRLKRAQISPAPENADKARIDRHGIDHRIAVKSDRFRQRRERLAKHEGDDGAFHT